MIAASRPELARFRTAGVGAMPASATWPRLMTGPHPRAVGSYGPAAMRWAMRHRMHAGRVRSSRWWQRLALGRALEHDETGALVWRTVIVSGPRQIGKSVFERVGCSWRLHQADRFGEPQTVLHVAHKLDAAREVWTPAARWAAGQYGRGAVRWANGEQQIELNDWSRWLIQAANDGAGVSYALTKVLVDEAWRVARGIVDNGLVPTMAESRSPQLWLVSTAGTSTSDLMAMNRALALATEQPGEHDNVLLIEWSAPPDPDLDIGDPAVWRAATPHWDATREAAVADAWRKVHDEDGELAFRQQWLNQWVPSLTRPVFDPEVWARLSTPKHAPSGRLGLGLDVAADRSHATVVAFGANGVFEVLEDRAGASWCAARLLELAVAQPVAGIGIDGTGPARSVADELAGLVDEDKLQVLTGREMAAASGQLYDRINADPPRVRARQHAALDGAVTTARWRNYGQARVWERTAASVPLLAGTAAMWAGEHAPAEPARFVIR
jgi:hypothetical protein